MPSRLIVVKVGTSGITTERGELDEHEMQNLVCQIAQATKQGDKMVLVTSGAVAAGVAELGITLKPNDIVFQQIAAATGQSVLMAKYRKLFAMYDLKVAQILLTAEDLSNREAYVHICDVLTLLLKNGVVPIINENDVTSVAELRLNEGYKVNFSDNDILSVLVAGAIGADFVIILSDVEGLYTKDPSEPDAELIRTVDSITEELKNSLRGKSKRGRGGIQSKIKAAEIATNCGIPVVISNSRKENVIIDVISGKEVGTFFKPQKKMTAMKRWIAYGAAVKGVIQVNRGAKEAILKGSSLLAVGVTNVVGVFNVGDVVSLEEEENRQEFARGNPNFNSNQLDQIKGLQITEVLEKLGADKPKEVIEHKNIHFIGE
ncbi:MAG: glutamate 5-kinase [Candidatus Bathyarchaeota archaeon]|uniref:glutamate 5-kinase n=1 Tax=Candidatus Bathycorpusculum sp. TaxID=2994959 RepID=UPI00282D25CF|nr:glutamate 5-kinase [Candidatus Termiticorpusculum sp.]MCL2257851.1 glutamate 5-kinase [Candidatus Termiticorpusculum sp.]MCL2291887.1 glutamate 5-kinase [Candidatus Termiticorpusculum sp.]